ncbi:MAG: hypothetical protein CME19_11575 [Gemmatimonadetes bacterium]|nr:hypothetical protein [Gemmatimonadota bacterium]
MDIEPRRYIGHYWERTDRIIHVIGKDVLKFHAFYWPGLLSSAGLRLPTELNGHGFLTVDGQKISKSLGNAVDPIPVIDRYVADALRYNLLAKVPARSDCDFSHTRLNEVYEKDRANTLGNLVSRLAALAVKANLSGIEWTEGSGRGVDIEDRRFNQALDRLWRQIQDINRDIESKRPWEYLQAGRADDLASKLKRRITDLLGISHRFWPFLPNTADEIRPRFTQGEIERGNPLFPRA